MSAWSPDSSSPRAYTRACAVWTTVVEPFAAHGRADLPAPGPTGVTACAGLASAKTASSAAPSPIPQERLEPRTRAAYPPAHKTARNG